MLDEFLQFLQEQCENHSIYVHGAQGEKGSAITGNWIRAKESGRGCVGTAMRFWKRQLRKGYGEAIRAFDCSGLIVHCLQKLGAICAEDMNANGLMRQCRHITKAELKKGDWLFRVNDSGRAYHIGVAVDDELNIIEAYGYKKGIVKRKLNAGGRRYWNAFGRPKLFEAEIASEELPFQYFFTRIQRKKLPPIAGEDVRMLQKLLAAKGFSPGSIDGVFGRHTRQAVLLFQKANALKADGIAGREIFHALGAAFGLKN